MTDRPIWGAEEDQPDEPTQLSGAGHPHGASAWDEEEATEIVQATDIGGFFGERFRVDARLGVGAMGRVLTAVDTKTNNVVALKVLHKDRAKSPEIVERFQREAAVLRQIQHPAIVHLVAFDRARDGTWWLAMEHLQGKTLKDRIHQGGPFTPMAAWPVLATICDGVAVAHAQGILHRDLKPENVLLLESGLPPCKILDFGLSRYTTKPDRITATGAVLGTPRYMAPELLAEASSVDERADVFALGVIAFEMLTGRSIYPADDFAQLFGCILEGRTVPLRQIRPDASPELERVIASAVAKDPAQRPRSADELANQLAAALRVSPDRTVFLPKPGAALEPPDPASGLREAKRQPAAANRPAARTIRVGSDQGRLVGATSAPTAPPATVKPAQSVPVVPAITPTSGIHVSRPAGAAGPRATSAHAPNAAPPVAAQAPWPSPAPQPLIQAAPFASPEPRTGPLQTPVLPPPAPPTPAPSPPITGPSLGAGSLLASSPGASAPSFTRPGAPGPQMQPAPQPGSERPSARAIVLWIALFLVAAVVTMVGAGALAYFLRTWLATR